MSEKSILEQALLQVKTLEEAVKANAKGILASTMKQELNELLKESMEDEDMDVTETEEVEEQSNPEEEEKDRSNETEPSEQEDDEDEVSDDNDDEDLDNVEPSDDTDSLDSDDEMSDDSSMEDEPSFDDEFSDDEIGDEMSDDSSMEDEPSFDDEFSDDEMSDDEDVLDMSNSSDEEVLKVFKAMKPEDGIIVKKDGNKVELETGEDDFIIKLDEEESEDENLSEDDDPFTSEVSEETDSEDETVYEIELDGEDESSEVEATESARTVGYGYHSGLKSKKVFKAGNKRDQINEEVEKLRKQNAEYKKALVLFKEKLNEVAVFNANLAYATRLFTEHSTTKQEKLNIMKRFDSVSTMTESKNLYTLIKTELESKKPISETVVEKISSTPSTSSSEVLLESKAYENPQFKRMKDLMSKLK